MSFSVTRTTRGLVSPSEPTPSGTLDLSVIDKIPVLRCNARTLHVFKHRGNEPAAGVIREALSKALAHYYPLAGRLKESSSTGLEIELSGEGAWFVEASAADCRLADVDYLGNTESVPYEYDHLLPDRVEEMEGLDPLVIMQVTEFGCGGFVIGLIFCHTICDGLGAAQFLNAVGELARGHAQLSITPVWQRNFSPLQPQVQNTNIIPNLPPPMPDYKLQNANIDIPLENIKKLKQQFHDQTGETCSAFEIIAACLWHCRTRAVEFDSNAEVKLVFFANCRQLLNPPLPNGFYGNCFFPVTITSSSAFLNEASINDVVKLIQHAKDMLPNEFEKYMKGEHGSTGVDPFAPPLIYTTLFISEWGRLGFNQVDYGWGPPVHVVPIQGSSIIPASIVGSLPSPSKGVRLMTWCVEDAHLQPFLDQMSKLS